MPAIIGTGTGSTVPPERILIDARITPVARVAVDEDRVEHLTREHRTVDDGAVAAAFIRTRRLSAASGLLKSLFFACRLHTLQAGHPPVLMASGSLGSNFRGPHERPPPVGSSIQVPRSLPVGSLPVGSFDSACAADVPASIAAPPARVDITTRQRLSPRERPILHALPLCRAIVSGSRGAPLLRAPRKPGFRPLAGPGTRRGFRRRPRKSVPLRYFRPCRHTLEGLSATSRPRRPRTHRAPG